MVYNKVKPLSEQLNGNLEGVTFDRGGSSPGVASGIIGRGNSIASSKDFSDFDSLSTVNIEESSYLKLKPFSKLDPTLMRLLAFLNCFGLTVNFGPSSAAAVTAASAGQTKWQGKQESSYSTYSRYFKIILTLSVAVITGEVVYDVNLRQSKLLAEQKRSTPLLTFVIVAYSWLTLVIPFVCDISLILIGSHLFRFYSRTTATVCNGMFFGRRTSVDSWYYYLVLVLIAFLDVIGQVVLLGVWPKSIDPYMRMILLQDTKSVGVMTVNTDRFGANNTANSTLIESLIESDDSSSGSGGESSATDPKIKAYLLDFLLGERYANSDLGVCLKIVCLVIQFMHSYAFLMIIISLANHYATAINNINDNLEKYEFRRLLKQLIILRDSSEQISLMISIPFSLVIMLVFMRQIALNGVFIQSTMQPYENWAVSLQSFTCSVSIFMVFIYCDGLQSASKQTHRLKTEQTVINENRGGNQSIYEFLDYLDRLSKSIRITFFNIIAINKSSLVGLYGHILTLTFVTS